jgi:hypothetical protein
MVRSKAKRSKEKRIIKTYTHIENTRSSRERRDDAEFSNITNTIIPLVRHDGDGLDRNRFAGLIFGAT